LSSYSLQRAIRDVNRRPQSREQYFRDREEFARGYELTDEERVALVSLNVTKLYALGVHGLLLRPFTILHKMSEPDYLIAIRTDV
jgi:hypothetical protein